MTGTPDVPIEVHLTPDDMHAALERDVRAGLTAPRKHLPPTWFYDERGSQLFDDITRLEEYYPTRAEREILEGHADEIAAGLEATTLIELGSGSSDKTRLLLAAMLRHGSLRTFVPFDVCEEAVAAAASALTVDFPSLTVRPLVGDFNHHLDRLPEGPARAVAFLGGTIGNFAPGPRRRFLFDLDATLQWGDCLLLGTDLVKRADRLVAAYDDRDGVTAAFNLNLLVRLNRELGADFDVEAFTHIAVWNAEDAWIEMRLRSERHQTVRIEALALDVVFRAGEDILTEISAKFTPDGLTTELWQAGLVVQKTWTDRAGDFQLTLATPHC